MLFMPSNGQNPLDNSGSREVQMEGLLAPARYIRRSTGVKGIKVIDFTVEIRVTPMIQLANTVRPEYDNFDEWEIGGGNDADQRRECEVKTVKTKAARYPLTGIEITRTVEEVSDRWFGHDNFAQESRFHTAVFGKTASAPPLS
ncbi:hypothetical protein ANCDUO_09073 [Ancylostoma duodenale]|uniref:Uncharacterized protein n=1 Tax=Ancylostoma duodenale TaxID=51022 RepID=A0A0C2GU01_9BILA|nr:hypothetical protein ANCDUO_09073 [Ancylostoma duodenale]